MGRHNCCVVSCGACLARHKGLSFHRIPPKGKTPTQDEWRARLLAVISRADKGFNESTAHICSRHFDDSCFVKCGRSRMLKEGSMPTKFMPQKTIPTNVPKPRKEPRLRPPPIEQKIVKYFNINELKMDLLKIKNCNWTFQCDDKTVLLFDKSLHSKVITVADDLQCTVTSRGKQVSYPEDAVETQGLRQILLKLDTMPWCPGVCNQDFQTFARLNCDDPAFEDSYHRVVLPYTSLENTSTSAIFSDNCKIIAPGKLPCEECKTVLSLLQRKKERLESNKSVHQNAPLCKLPKHKLVSLLKTSRQDNKKLLAEINAKLIDTETIAVDDNTHQSLEMVLNNNQQAFKTALNNDKLDNDFLKLFWEEQKKAFTRNNYGMRWHPMMLRYAIMLHSLSPATYRILRDTNVLHLPGESTLRDFTNAIKPETGIQEDVILDLAKAASKLNENQKFVVLCHDEMQIKSDLVYDKRGEKLIGFVDQKRWSFNVESLCDSIATHVLVFFVVGINSHIKQSVAYFATKTTSACDIMTKFWSVVGYLEELCGLKVVISVSDKASPNMTFYKMHGTNTDSNVTYKVDNLFAKDRFVYFISDAPHLLKTLRNCLERSRLHGPHLWANGHEIAWDHVLDVWKRDRGKELYQTKLTTDHVHLTPRTRMSVDLAAKVMSDSTARILSAYFPQSHKQTAYFISLVDRFFDCLNTRNLDEAHRRRKPYLAAYVACDDERFTFLREEFLPFFHHWKSSTLERQGNFSAVDRKKMFISKQTYDGLQMTVLSFIEVTQYLLMNGVKFVLSQRFCQDPLEEHFGRHRSMGRRSENPSLYTFGYQENKIRLQRSLIQQFKPKGNVRKASREKEAIIVTESPMKKIKRQRNSQSK